MIEYYDLKIERPACNNSFESLFCYVNFQNNIEEVLPYLNSSLGGHTYIADPPSVTFKANGKLITVHRNQIAINALKDEDEAKKIAAWMVREINETWENKDTITPSTESEKTASLPMILAKLPKTNCKECGCPTCMVFAIRLRDKINEPNDCPHLKKEAAEYLERIV